VLPLIQVTDNGKRRNKRESTPRCCSVAPTAEKARQDFVEEQRRQLERHNQQAQREMMKAASAAAADTTRAARLANEHPARRPTKDAAAAREPERAQHLLAASQCFHGALSTIAAPVQDTLVVTDTTTTIATTSPLTADTRAAAPPVSAATPEVSFTRPPNRNNSLPPSLHGYLKSIESEKHMALPSVRRLMAQFESSQRLPPSPGDTFERAMFLHRCSRATSLQRLLRLRPTVEPKARDSIDDEVDDLLRRYHDNHDTNDGDEYDLLPMALPVHFSSRTPTISPAESQVRISPTLISSYSSPFSGYYYASPVESQAASSQSQLATEGSGETSLNSQYSSSWEPSFAVPREPSAHTCTHTSSPLCGQKKKNDLCLRFPPPNDSFSLFQATSLKRGSVTVLTAPPLLILSVFRLHEWHTTVALVYLIFFALFLLSVLQLQLHASSYFPFVLSLSTSSVAVDGGDIVATVTNDTHYPYHSSYQPPSPVVFHNFLFLASFCCCCCVGSTVNNHIVYTFYSPYSYRVFSACFP
jgi:hypothetical protein